MRISDWSSDVCSSDLCTTAPPLRGPHPPRSGPPSPGSFSGSWRLLHFLHQMCHRARHMPFYRARGNAINCGDLVLRHIFQSKYQEKRARQLGERRNGGFQSLEFGSTDDDEESAEERKSTSLKSSHKCASRMPC